MTRCGSEVVVCVAGSRTVVSFGSVRESCEMPAAIFSLVWNCFLLASYLVFSSRVLRVSASLLAFLIIWAICFAVVFAMPSGDEGGAGSSLAAVRYRSSRACGSKVASRVSVLAWFRRVISLVRCLCMEWLRGVLCGGDLVVSAGLGAEGHTVVA